MKIWRRKKSLIRLRIQLLVNNPWMRLLQFNPAQLLFLRNRHQKNRATMSSVIWTPQNKRISFSSLMPFSTGTYVTPTRVSSSSRTHLKSARFQKPSHQFSLNLKRKRRTRKSQNHPKTCKSSQKLWRKTRSSWWRASKRCSKMSRQSKIWKLQRRCSKAQHLSTCKMNWACQNWLRFTNRSL